MVVVVHVCRKVAELEMELECERLRREEVESQADQLRKHLHQQTVNLELSQDMLQTVRRSTTHTVETLLRDSLN